MNKHNTYSQCMAKAAKLIKKGQHGPAKNVALEAVKLAQSSSKHQSACQLLKRINDMISESAYILH